MYNWYQKKTINEVPFLSMGRSSFHRQVEGTGNRGSVNEQFALEAMAHEHR